MSDATAASGAGAPDDVTGEARADPPRLLFVLSNDHGELFNAIYFLAGTSFTASFLMPPKLFDTHRPGFPYPAYRYASAQDVERVYQAENPDIVFLFSGYLFVMNQTLGMPGLEKLFALWRGRGARLATSDPCIGLMAEAVEASFNVSPSRRAWLTEHCREISRLLEDVTHVYLAPIGSSRVRHVSFYNPNIVLDRAALTRSRNKLATWSRINARKDRWVFVISRLDYGIQTTVWGPERFAELLAGKLRDASHAGRQPILIAPPACLEQVRARSEGVEDLITLSSCNFGLYMFMLYDAEYAFYWNLFSASIVGRLLNRKPFFLFDQGHQARVIKRYLHVGTGHFYPGCKMSEIALDQEEGLVPERLAYLASREQELVFEPACWNFARSPTPEQAVGEIR